MVSHRRGEPGGQFRRVHLREGYDVGEVDQFFQSGQQRTISEIEAVTFATRVRTGYDMREVDLALDAWVDRLSAAEQSEPVGQPPSGPVTASDATSEGQDQPVTFGHGTNGFRAVSWAGFMVPVVLAALTAVQSTKGTVVPDLFGFGLGSAFFWLAGTAGIAGAEGSLIWTNVVTVWTVPAAAVRRVTHEDGLELWTTDGRVLDHVGYGGSVIGSITGNKQAAAVQARIEEWVNASRGPRTGPTGAAEPVRRGFRRAVVTAAVLHAAVFVAAGTLLHAFVRGR